MKKNYSVFSFFFLICIAAGWQKLSAQIVINEVSSASVPGYLDEDGDQEDWIEFYNIGSSAVNMAGYTIRANESGTAKSWTFPSITIKSHDYLTVFCSGKDRKAYFDHWEVPVYANNPWKYFIGTTDPPSNWRTIGFNDASWATGMGGIGYGDGDDSTVIPPVNSVFMRKNFWVADTSIIPTAALLIDYDDGFVAYLNDVEIARANIGVQGDHPSYSTSAYDEHEATMYQTGNISGAYFVAPEVIDAALKPGNNVFSIQTHNYAAATAPDLTCIAYFLIGVNDTTVTYFPFPATVNLHTNFTLKSSGQLLTLNDASGTQVDQYNIGAMELGNSYGRRPNGTNNWYYFDSPTPDTTNNTSAYYTAYIEPPHVDLPAGFYSGPQLISLSNPSGTGVIRYTLDGKDPTPSSPLYSAPISISSTSVVRARCYSSNPLELPSEIATNSYFINENISLPVVSLVSDPFNLFDYNYGIYVYGPNADTTTIPFYGSNFWNGWERPANIEYFDASGNNAFETPAAISIQGNFSKAWPQRGFTVKTKDNYKGKNIFYRLFPDKPGITEYKSFNIRNAGSDWNTCHMRDRFIQKTVQKKTHLDIMDGRPSVLFINGNYWGVYELRERQDKDYIESNSGVSADSIDFLEFDGNIIEGSNTDFLSMANAINSLDMSVPTNYQAAKNNLDIENFADYFITETYVVNIDWLGSYTNNIKFWRPDPPPGKWRYMLWDTDLSLGFGEALGTGSDTMNMLAIAINPPTSNPHSGMLRGLLNNPEFKNYFINRYADLMNTIFLPAEMRAKAGQLHDEMLPEMARHFNRWQAPSLWGGFIGSSTDVPSWETNISHMLDFCDLRIGHARDYVQSQFGLTKQVDVSLDVSPPGAGTIQISTIVPDSLPWTGVYFDGNPVTITARANPGYTFKNWTSDVLLPSGDLNASIRLNISSDDRFVAHFDELQNYFGAFPNPFDNELSLVYELPSDKQVSIKLFNTLGQLVYEPVKADHIETAGIHTLHLNPRDIDLPQGVYFAELRSGDFHQQIKLVNSRSVR